MRNANLTKGNKLLIIKNMKTIFYLLPKLAINITCAYTMYKSQDYLNMSRHICKSILIIIKIYIIYKEYKSKNTL